MSYNDQNNDDDERERWIRHMGWSAKQGRILTAGGRAAEYYTADRGYDFHETELPHYHLMTTTKKKKKNQREDVQKNNKNEQTNQDANEDTTRTIFRMWRQRQGKKWDDAPIVGAWKRTLFYGGWEHSTARDEQVFNLQTPSLFIDLRLPTTRLRSIDRPHVTGLNDLDTRDLRRLARQHVFGGYTVMNGVDDQGVKGAATTTTTTTTTTVKEKIPYDLVCTRHHVMDWNFVGRPRNRPNKWYVELPIEDDVNDHDTTTNMWKEWAYATDDHGQQYYCEQWERFVMSNPLDRSNKKNNIPMIALRKAAFTGGSVGSGSTSNDGLLIVMGSHFNYLIDDRTPRVAALELQNSVVCSSLVETVDQCLDENNVEAARAWLSLRGGHGYITIKDGWKVDAATEFWSEGRPLFATREEIHVVVETASPSSSNDTKHSWKDDAHVRWKGDRWEIFECNLSSAQELQDLFWTGSEWAAGRSCNN